MTTAKDRVPYDSMREYMQILEERGLLKHITAEVDQCGCPSDVSGTLEVRATGHTSGRQKADHAAAGPRGCGMVQMPGEAVPYANERYAACLHGSLTKVTEAPREKKDSP